MVSTYHVLALDSRDSCVFVANSRWRAPLIGYMCIMVEEVVWNLIFNDVKIQIMGMFRSVLGSGNCHWQLIGQDWIELVKVHQQDSGTYLWTKSVTISPAELKACSHATDLLTVADGSSNFHTRI